MTEDDAKAKWCPFARVLVESDESRDHSRIASANRLEVRGEGVPDAGWRATFCIASACMAWRWSEKQPSGLGYWADGTPHANSGAVGFCGLAGAPQ